MSANGPSAVDALRPRDLVEHFVVDEVVWESSHCRAFAARDTILDRPVRLKLWRLPEVVVPLQVVQVTHPGTLSVYELDRWRGHALAVVEEVAGQTLAEWLARRPRERDETARVRNALVEAVAALRAASVPCCLLSATDVVIDRYGRPRLDPTTAAGAAPVADPLAGLTALLGSDAIPDGHSAELAARVWNDDTRARIRTALTATGHAYAGDSAVRMFRIIDERVAGWIEERDDVVAMLHDRHELTAAVADRRLDALSAWLHRLASIIELTTTDCTPETVDGAVEIAHDLPVPNVGGAADAQRLGGESGELARELARLATLRHLRREDETRRLAQEIVARAAASGDRAAEARAHIALAYEALARGDVLSCAAVADDAVPVAAASGDDAAFTTALSLYACSRMLQGDPDEQLVLAVEVAARSTDDDAARGWAYNDLGVTYDWLHRPARARRFYELAVSFKSRALGAHHPDTLRSAANLAENLLDLGFPAEALELAEASWQRAAVALGDHHPMLSPSCDAIARCYVGLGQPAEALRWSERARDAWGRQRRERKDLSTTPRSPYAATEGEALLALGRREEAAAVTREEAALAALPHPLYEVLRAWWVYTVATSDSVDSVRDVVEELLVRDDIPLAIRAEYRRRLDELTGSG